MIVSRTEVMTRLTREQEREKMRTVEAVNKILNEAVDFPVRIPVERLPSNFRVRESVLEAMRTAGWRVEPEWNGEPKLVTSSVVVYIVQ